MALTGCTPTSPTPTSAPTTEPKPVDDPTAAPTPTPAELVVGGGGVELYDSEGTLIGSFIWSDETDDSLEVLELAFGPAPEPGLNPGDGGHYADYATYDFAGVIYYTAVNLEKPRDEYFAPATVQIDTGEPINGVRVLTTDGLRVGGTLDEVLALSPPLNYPHSLGTAYLVDPVDPAKVTQPDDFTDMVALIVDPDGTLMRIIAPYPSRYLF